jgi:hypothetical protein
MNDYIISILSPLNPDTVMLLVTNATINVNKCKQYNHNITT